MRSISKWTIIVALAMALSASWTAHVAGETIVFGDLSWDSAQVHNRIAGFIIEHGYGYNVDYEFGESIPILVALQRGDVDLIMEGWTDNWYDTMLEAHRDQTIITLGFNFPDAPQGWYVPTYVIEGDEERGIEPMAPDLESVFDLPQYAELFQDPEDPDKGRLYNSPTGWVAHDINLEKMEVYGLDEYFNSFDPGSDAALGGAMLSAYERGEPILASNWEPNWPLGLMDMTMLEEPEYDPDQWDENYGTAYPDSLVEIVVHVDFPQRFPNVASFLSYYETTLDQNNEFLAYMQTEEASIDEAAIWFLQNYKDVWTEWVFDPDVEARVLEALDRI